MREFQKTTGFFMLVGGYIGRIEYGFGCHQGNGEPYFSMSGEEWDATITGQPKGREPISCGQCQEDLLEKAIRRRDKPIDVVPLKAACPWHLFGLVKGPMHYVANAQYWADHVTGKREFAKYDRVEGDPKEEGKRRVVSHTLLGKLDTDPDVDSLIALPPDQFAMCLEVRLPPLRKKFVEEVVMPLGLQQELVKALKFFDISFIEWSKTALIDGAKEAL